MKQTKRSLAVVVWGNCTGATKDKGNKMDFASPFKLLFNFVKARKKARMISYLNKINPEIKGSSAISPNLPIEKATRISDLLEK